MTFFRKNRNHQVDQSTRLEGLRDVRGRAGSLGSLFIESFESSDEEYDRRLTQLAMAANVGAKLIPVLPGHVDVCQHNVRPNFIKVLDGSISVVDLDDAKICIRERPVH